MAHHASTWLMGFFLAMPPLVGGIQPSPAPTPATKIEWQDPSQGKPKPQKPPRMEPRGQKPGQTTGEPTLKRRKPPAPPPHG